MRLILLGAAGSGKGTQGEMISEKYKIPNISIGELFRENIKKQTQIGKVAEGYIAKGMLVPDEVTLDMLKQRLEQTDCKNGFILDGFPRNSTQANALEGLTKIDKVISITVSTNELLRRIAGRRLCESCGNNTHIDWLKGKTTCPKCDGKLIQRKDDADMNSVKKRLQMYEDSVKPLIDHYRQKGLLFEVSGEQGKENVFKQISRVLNNEH